MNWWDFLMKKNMMNWGVWGTYLQVLHHHHHHHHHLLLQLQSIPISSLHQPKDHHLLFFWINCLSTFFKQIFRGWLGHLIVLHTQPPTPRSVVLIFFFFLLFFFNISNDLCLFYTNSKIWRYGSLYLDSSSNFSWNFHVSEYCILDLKPPPSWLPSWIHSGKLAH